jgi:CheY-like chemotaxis protein
MPESFFYIDDNEYEHYIVESLIKSYSDSKKITFFLKGREAIHFLEKNKSNFNELPDIILLDLFMPDFSGWDFLEEFKIFYPELAKKIKIYIVSSSVDKQDIARSESYPFVKSFFTKPLTPAMVKEFDASV